MIYLTGDCHGDFNRNLSTYAEERRRTNKSGLPYRVKGVSWWEQELPSAEEMQEGRDNLSKAGYSVDFAITHCLSGRMQERMESVLAMGRMDMCAQDAREKDILNDYFDELEEKLQYQYWFCGHYHEKLRLDGII